MISIIDYNTGNLHSVTKAFEKLGHQVSIVRTASELEKVERLVLPGVGAFPEAIATIHRNGLFQPIKAVIDKGIPTLGICLGLQLLFDFSEEGKGATGLGILPGTVKAFALGPEYKVPHMGWNRFQISQDDNPLLNGISPNDYFYFVHSYFVVPNEPEVIALTTDYGGKFCAMIRKKNLFATQFHPEKSQRAGLELLKNFANYCY
ncbi:MAG: imidazole glycerol phosphate synthase subunit HisH [Pirellulaceae bacterium]|nr:imidazole glycerol phosphate synthase subunit HisH [Pirellulaceae bacterium]